MNRTRKVYGCRIAVVVSHWFSLCWVSKVGAVESRRLGCLSVCGDSSSRRWGWSWCLVQIVSAAVRSGCRCSWRQLMMWMHCLLRLDDHCPGLCSLWLTGYVSMWSQSSRASPSSVIAHGLGAAGAVAWLCRNSCWDKLELVCRCYCLIVQERLLG